MPASIPTPHPRRLRAGRDTQGRETAQYVAPEDQPAPGVHTATVANVYLAMYPTPALALAFFHEPGLIRRGWEALNRVTPELLLGEGRVYGGGLHKLEPKELANVPVAKIADLLPDQPVRQSELLFEAAE